MTTDVRQLAARAATMLGDGTEDLECARQWTGGDAWRDNLSLDLSRVCAEAGLAWIRALAEDVGYDTGVRRGRVGVDARGTGDVVLFLETEDLRRDRDAWLCRMVLAALCAFADTGRFILAVAPDGPADRILDDVLCKGGLLFLRTGRNAPMRREHGVRWHRHPRQARE